MNVRRAAGNAGAHRGRLRRPADEGLIAGFRLGQECRIVEIQIDHADSGGLLINAQAARQCRLAHKGATAGFATHQAHGFEFCIDARRGDQGHALLGSKFSVRMQPGAGREAALPDLVGPPVDQGLVSNLRHVYSAFV